MMMSACGVMCSECPAYLGAEKGPAYQGRIAEAWHRIYGRGETANQIACGGCLGSDEAIFYNSPNCRARRCCLSKDFKSCAECPEESCALLEEAQAVWDAVPQQMDVLSPEDFETYARPYCDHRNRLAARRIATRGRSV